MGPDFGNARARASRDALQVISLVRDPAYVRPLVKIATNHPDGLIDETGFNTAWDHSDEDWRGEVWDAYRDAFQFECAKANVGLIHSESGYDEDGRGIEASIHAVDLDRWRLKDGQRMRPGVIAGGTHTEFLEELFESTKPAWRDLLRRRR